MLLGLFDSVDKILYCSHSKETSPVALSHSTKLYWFFCKMKFGNFVENLHLATLGIKKITATKFIPLLNPFTARVKDEVF